MNITQAAAVQKLIEMLANGSADIQTDNEGQLIVYTGFYEQSDTTLSNEPDPEFGS